jgi:surface antigen
MHSAGEMGDLLLRIRSIVLGGWGLLLISCVPALASSGGNCVAYAREVTGVDLSGNAAAWWPHAEGRYDRGQQPAVGAILVFKAYGRMRVGHVAVVSRIVGAREVLVDQANWVRGRVTKAMSVVDASPLNDWTSVKVLEPNSGTHGRENPTFGFIYPRALPASFAETTAEPRQAEQRHAAHTASSTESVTQDRRRHGHDEARQANATPQAADRHGHRDVAKTHDAERHERSRPVLADTDKTRRHLADNERAGPRHKATDAKLAYVY